METVLSCLSSGSTTEQLGGREEGKQSKERSSCLCDHRYGRIIVFIYSSVYSSYSSLLLFFCSSVLLSLEEEESFCSSILLFSLGLHLLFCSSVLGCPSVTSILLFIPLLLSFCYFYSPLQSLLLFLLFLCITCSYFCNFCKLIVLLLLLYHSLPLFFCIYLFFSFILLLIFSIFSSSSTSCLSSLQFITLTLTISSSLLRSPSSHLIVSSSPLFIFLVITFLLLKIGFQLTG